MSREVRRVLLDFQHPIEHNPHWRFQASTPYGRDRPPSRLHGPTEMFTPLFGTPVSVAQKTWDDEHEQWEAGTHEHLVWLLKYHDRAGWVDHKGVRRAATAYEVYDDSGEIVVDRIWPTSAAEIRAHESYEEYAGKRPTSATNMPDFDVPEAELGWCLYETVSEGTPVTPVFATAAELVDHLCTVGQDYHQVPMRRASAEIIVGQGRTVASMVSVGGTVYRSDVDADLLAEALSTRPETSPDD